MPDYSKAKIYKLISDETDQIYVGSTVEKYLSSRLSGHKCLYKKWLRTGTAYTTSYEIVKHPDCTIILIENYPCESCDELRAREQYHIDRNENCCNKYHAFITEEDARARKVEKQKIYYRKNKRELNSKLRRCECCNRSYKQVNLYDHYKTKKHLKNKANFEEEEVV